MDNNSWKPKIAGFDKYNAEIDRIDQQNLDAKRHGDNMQALSEANRIAREANEIAEEANKIAKQAKENADKANRHSLFSIVIAIGAVVATIIAACITA